MLDARLKRGLRVGLQSQLALVSVVLERLLFGAQDERLQNFQKLSVRKSVHFSRNNAERSLTVVLCACRHLLHRAAMSAPPADAAPLSADELAVYDRSIRTWGLDVQAKLSAAKVLVVGLPGAACEVAKNVVLAGVGRVDLIDEPGAQAAAGNFLAPHDATGRRVVSLTRS